MSHGENFLTTKGYIPNDEEKHHLYQKATTELHAMLVGIDDATVILSTVAAVLHHLMPHYFWTGFYRICGDVLRVGPYQGTPACLEIAHGRGVCGSAWAEARTIVVANVHDFPGHIACDARSASEIVVPWYHNGKLIAVLDIDSTLPAAFDEIDKTYLEALALANR